MHPILIAWQSFLQPGLPFLDQPICVLCSSAVSVELFDNLCSDLIQQIKVVCERALQQAGLRACHICSVERLGGASRTPAVVRAIQDVFALYTDPRRHVSLPLVVCMLGI